MRIGFSRLSLFLALGASLFVAAASLSVEQQYTYDTTDAVHELAWRADGSGGYSASVSITVPPSRDSFFLSIPKSFDVATGEEFHATFRTPSQTYEAGIDTDGDERTLTERRYFLAPYWGKTSDSMIIDFHADVSESELPSEFDLVMLDSRSWRYGVKFGADVLRARADDFFSANGIISRSEWGADEELRYEDSEVWKRIAERNAGYVPTAADKRALERRKKIDDYLLSEFPGDYQLASVDHTDPDTGRPLVWSEQKTKYVKMITVHHTADSNTADREDAEIVRSIYYYHAIVRGWGDIGYNYVIGQRGKIYEGRAGGDYVVAAHAVWNNRSTVGVSMIGNFEQYSVNADQLKGLKSIVKALALHYGIDLAGTMSTHVECVSGQDCLLRDQTSTRLTGHRDIGHTSCPGKDLYDHLPDLRADMDYSKDLAFVANPVVSVVETAASSTGSSAPAIVAPVPATAIGPKIRLKLSYPHAEMLFSAYVPGEALTVSYGKKSAKLPKDKKFSVAVADGKLVMRVGKKLVKIPEGLKFSASAVRIDSWERIPSWDKSRTYNDNLFRGAIELRVEDGKLLVINELSLEDMLYGLAEISNDVPAEKAKAIIVSARSYANFYTDPAHRKFKDKPYDGSDDPNVFQKYLGYGFESRSPKVREYVDTTRGEVVTYQGVPIKTWYFTQSDGKTRSEREWCIANGGTEASCPDTPYLQSVLDPGSAGKTRLGHGVGMSGAGATYFATVEGWNYQEILKYFYTGVEVSKIY
jgi:hypothetical protein